MTTEMVTQREQIRIQIAVGRWLAPLGLIRLANFFPLDKELPAHAAAEFKAWVDSTRFMESNAAEFYAQPESMRQFQAAGSLGTLPLMVLTATDHGYPAEQSALLEAEWQAMQKELVALSSNSVQLLVDGSTHGSWW